MSHPHYRLCPGCGDPRSERRWEVFCSQACRELHEETAPRCISCRLPMTKDWAGGEEAFCPRFPCPQFQLELELEFLGRSSLSRA